MKRWIGLPALSVLGLVCGGVAGMLRTAFVVNCGESCPTEPLALALSCALIFPAVGFILWRKAAQNRTRILLVALGMTGLVLLPAAARYGYELHQRYWGSPMGLGVPNVDFSLMAIATRPVDASLLGKRLTVPIKAWERCVFGVIACDRRPRTAEAICFGSGKTLVIEESDWPHFERVPSEDLPGVRQLPPSMNLCATSS